MNKIYKLIILLVMIGVASAAVYVAINPEACLSFTRDKPTGSPVMTLIECGEGYASNCDMGTMNTNILNKQIYHKNTCETQFDGIVYFNLSCTTGFYFNAKGEISDFNEIIFIDPHGNIFQCNNVNCIEQIETNTIKITPTTDIFGFVYDITTFTNIDISFVDGAYGDYVLTAYVDVVPII